MDNVVMVALLVGGSAECAEPLTGAQWHLRTYRAERRHSTNK